MSIPSLIQFMLLNGTFDKLLKINRKSRAQIRSIFNFMKPFLGSSISEPQFKRRLNDVNIENILLTMATLKSNVLMLHFLEANLN